MDLLFGARPASWLARCGRGREIGTVVLAGLWSHWHKSCKLRGWSCLVELGDVSWLSFFRAKYFLKRGHVWPVIVLVI